MTTQILNTINLTKEDVDTLFEELDHDEDYGEEYKQRIFVDIHSENLENLTKLIDVYKYHRMACDMETLVIECAKNGTPKVMYFLLSMLHHHSRFDDVFTLHLGEIKKAAEHNNQILKLFENFEDSDVLLLSSPFCGIYSKNDIEKSSNDCIIPKVNALPKHILWSDNDLECYKEMIDDTDLAEDSQVIFLMNNYDVNNVKNLPLFIEENWIKC